MTDIILILILCAIAAAIVFYLIREKKRGVTCVGCPYARECAKKRNGTCGCGSSHTEDRKTET